MSAVLLDFTPDSFIPDATCLTASCCGACAGTVSWSATYWCGSVSLAAVDLLILGERGGRVWLGVGKAIMDFTLSDLSCSTDARTSPLWHGLSAELISIYDGREGDGQL